VVCLGWGDENYGSFTFGVGDKTLKKQYNITITHLPEA
jgi:hypothetical protein